MLTPKSTKSSLAATAVKSALSERKIRDMVFDELGITEGVETMKMPGKLKRGEPEVTLLGFYVEDVKLTGQPISKEDSEKMRKLYDFLVFQLGLDAKVDDTGAYIWVRLDDAKQTIGESVAQGTFEYDDMFNGATTSAAPPTPSGVKYGDVPVASIVDLLDSACPEIEVKDVRQGYEGTPTTRRWWVHIEVDWRQKPPVGTVTQAASDRVQNTTTWNDWVAKFPDLADIDVDQRSDTVILHGDWTEREQGDPENFVMPPLDDDSVVEFKQRAAKPKKQPKQVVKTVGQATGTGKYEKQWEVRSHSNPNKHYTVSRRPDGTYECSCPHWTRRVPRPECKHIKEVKAGGGVEI